MFAIAIALGPAPPRLGDAQPLAGIRGVGQ